MLKNYWFLIGRFVAFLLLSVFTISNNFAQKSSYQRLTMDEAVTRTLAINPAARNAELKVRALANKKNNALTEALSITYSFGSNSISGQNNLLEISQKINSPFTIYQQSVYNKQSANLAQSEQTLVTSRLITETKVAYTNWLYNLVRFRLISRTTDLINLFIDSTGLQNVNSDSSSLEHLNLETQYADIQNQYFQAKQDYRISTNNIHQLIFSEDRFIPSDTTLELYTILTPRMGSDKFNPTKTLQYFQQQSDLQKADIAVEKSRIYPGFQVGYYNWDAGNDFHIRGFKVGLSVPLWFGIQNNKIKEARINSEIATNNIHDQEFTLGLTIENLKIQLDQLFVSISYYRENALKLADMQDKAAVKSFSEKQISYLIFLEQIEKSLTIKLAYLLKVRDYNLTAIQLEYYIN